MKTSELTMEQSLHAKGQNIIIRFAAWVTQKELTFLVITVGMVIMLLWAGAFKMTVPAADGIAPLVENNPFISWLFKVFGRYHGSDIIGLTEWIAALLMIIGLFKPQAGIIGGAIGVVMFFTTSTMLITTPDALVKVNGFYYMNNLGLFLFKDIINLGASFYLITKFGQKAMAPTGKNAVK